MLDGVSLDHLRIFIAACEEGSFSAAARKLRRAQSMVSQTVALLEGRLDVVLFDRTGRIPVLTEQGQALLHEARAVVRHMDAFKARARTLAGGLEPELSVAVDVMFPMQVLTETVGAFQARFPKTPLRLYVEALGAVVQPVIDGECRIGVMGSMPEVPTSMESEPLLDVHMVTVCAPHHPLAALQGELTARQLGEHVHLILTDRTPLTAGKSFGVFTEQVWKLADLGAKHSFLKAGFGWGHMPEAMVEEDLAAGRLVALAIAPRRGKPLDIAMQAAWRRDAPPGPAGRWFIAQLKQHRQSKPPRPR